MRHEGNDGTAFAQACRAIRSLIGQAARRPERLLVGDLARMTGLSPTPVREALSRLVGEGLIEEHRGDGYFIPQPNARDVEEFYILARSLGLAATAQRAGGFGNTRPAIEAPGDPDAAAFADLFDRLAMLSGNRSLWTETRRLNARMAGIRRIEPTALPGYAVLRAESEVLFERDDTGGMAGWIERYAHAGLAAASDIADRLASRRSRI